MTNPAADPATMFRLDGRTALVTGASQGLGRSFALTLARAGAKVALASRTRAKLEAVQAEIEAEGGTACVVELDVRNREDCIRAVKNAADALGPIHVLVNNSGIAITRRLLEVSEDDWRDVLDTNLTGAWFVAQATARHMVEHGQGASIVNISSLLGTRTHVGVIGYNAAKAGLDHVTRQMAVELARKGVRVNALAPGYFETDMNREWFASPPGLALISRVPMQRLGGEGDLDGPLLFLASEASRYVTGQIIGVDGGHAVSLI